MEFDDDLPQWEQQPGEPALWYDRFHEYLLIGSDRSVLGLYNRHRAKEQKPKAKHVPESWKTAAKHWQWKSRALAWDKYQQQLAMQAEMQQRKAMNQKHLEASQAWQALAVRSLTKKMVVNEPYLNEKGEIAYKQKIVSAFVEDPAAAFRIWQGGVQGERMARGLPTRMIEFMQMTDEELMAKRDELIGRITGTSHAGNGDETPWDEGEADESDT